MSIEVNSFFDLEESDFQGLWPDSKVFSALSGLTDFLKKFPLGQIRSRLPEGVFLFNPEQIFIDEGVVIEPGVCLIGPCYIGEKCTLRHTAYLRGPVFLAPGSLVGHASEVKNSIFLEAASAAHFAYVGDSILGKKVNLGAGVKCANLKLGRDEIILNLEKEKIHTGLNKMGAVIGDQSQIGCNTVLNPGTLIGKDVLIYPNLTVGGAVPEGSVVKNKKGYELCFRRKHSFS
ncbi:MAG: UDP-N-acetylglucosamine diphosphorylase [Parachlamydiales bacterium]|jgi:NDP-sugar pyrophosphorylase family protein